MQDAMVRLMFVLAVLNQPQQVDVSDHDRAMVYRAYGEARGDGVEAIAAVVGTMMCREQEGYKNVLSAYHAQDYPVPDSDVELIMSMAHCQGKKYALSLSDIAYLKIPGSIERTCYNTTCTFEVFYDGR